MVNPRRVEMTQFALIIGIDQYKSDAITNLCGARSDAEAFATFFRKRGIPENHLTVLKNEAATRLNILEELRRLADDPRIQYDDSIVIFFAGHGSQAPAPPNWEAGGRVANIQLILPYDAFCASGDQMVAPIPDRTLCALVEAIAHKKGNNIVFIRDACFSASHHGTRGFSCSYDRIRSSPPPSNFKLPESLDKEIYSFNHDHHGSRSHILLSASNSSGHAWESHGRGVFTVALLDLLEDCQIDKLRYCDIVMRIDVDPKQTPHVEGFNCERYIFTTISSSIQYFIPAYTRITRNGQIGYVLNGGTAHGLSVGDEFAIYSNMDCPLSEGTMVVKEVGSFYSVMGKPLSGGIPLSGQSVAVRIKQGRSHVLRVHIRPGDKAIDILSLVRDLNFFNIADSPNDCDIDISMRDNQADVKLVGMGSTHRCRIGSTVSSESDLAPVLKASSQFLLKFNRTSDFPAITQHIILCCHELLRSERWLPGSPVTNFLPFERESDSLTLCQGSTYGIKLTNNSPYDLHPVVQFFDPSNHFQIDTLYRPVYSSNMLVPLQKNGGQLLIGCPNTWNSSPLTISSSPGKGLKFLKISLFSRPLDSPYNASSFRTARRLPDDVKGPWATIFTKVASCSSNRPSLRTHKQQASQELLNKYPNQSCVVTMPQLGSYRIARPFGMHCSKLQMDVTNITALTRSLKYIGEIMETGRLRAACRDNGVGV